jgi:hypothetical protein
VTEAACDDGCAGNLREDGDHFPAPALVRVPGRRVGPGRPGQGRARAGVRGPARDGGGERGRVVGLEDQSEATSAHELRQGATARSDHRDAEDLRLGGDEAERLFPHRRDEDEIGRGHHRVHVASRPDEVDAPGHARARRQRLELVHVLAGHRVRDVSGHPQDVVRGQAAEGLDGEVHPLVPPQRRARDQHREGAGRTPRERGGRRRTRCVHRRGVAHGDDALRVDAHPPYLSGAELRDGEDARAAPGAGADETRLRPWAARTRERERRAVPVPDEHGGGA